MTNESVEVEDAEGRGRDGRRTDAGEGAALALLAVTLVPLALALRLAALIAGWLESAGGRDGAGWGGDGKEMEEGAPLLLRFLLDAASVGCAPSSSEASDSCMDWSLDMAGCGGWCREREGEKAGATRRIWGGWVSEKGRKEARVSADGVECGGRRRTGVECVMGQRAKESRLPESHLRTPGPRAFSPGLLLRPSLPSPDPSLLVPAPVLHPRLLNRPAVSFVTSPHPFTCHVTYIKILFEYMYILPKSPTSTQTSRLRPTLALLIVAMSPRSTTLRARCSLGAVPTARSRYRARPRSTVYPQTLAWFFRNFHERAADTADARLRKTASGDLPCAPQAAAARDPSRPHNSDRAGRQAPERLRAASSKMRSEFERGCGRADAWGLVRTTPASVRACVPASRSRTGTAQENAGWASVSEAVQESGRG